MPFNCSSASSNIPAKTLQTNQQPQQHPYPIRSTNPAAEESREHLLGNAQPPATSLTRPGRPRSITSSIYSDTSTIAIPQTPYRGFPSREAYMSALEEFIESKMYMSTHTRTLTGFYGPETMEDVIATRPDIEFGWQKRRKARKAEKARRMTVAPGMEVLPEEDPSVVVVVAAGGNGRDDDGGEAGNGQVVQRVETNDSQTQRLGRMGRLSRVFSGGRRATVG